MKDDTNGTRARVQKLPGELLSSLAARLGIGHIRTATAEHTKLCVDAVVDMTWVTRRGAEQLCVFVDYRI